MDDNKMNLNEYLLINKMISKLREKNLFEKEFLEEILYEIAEEQSLPYIFT